MKKKEYLELLSKNEGELKNLLGRLREETAKSILEKFNAKTKNINTFGKNKKQIAQILTILRSIKGEQK